MWREFTLVLSLQLEYSIPFLTRELLVHSIKQLQAQVLLIKASQGYFNMERGITDKSVMLLVLDTLRSVLKEVGA